jgi:hypothetical protein
MPSAPPCGMASESLPLPVGGLLILGFAFAAARGLGLRLGSGIAFARGYVIRGLAHACAHL